MTKREMYTAVIEGKVTDEVIEGFKGLVATLDSTNAKHKTKKNEAHAEVDATVLAVMTNEQKLAKEIAEMLPDYTISKVVASAKRLADEGKVTITKVAKGSRNISYYALAE